jgi:FkbM family methyltransferase
MLSPGCARLRDGGTIYYHRHDDAITHALKSRGSWEAFESDLIGALLGPGDCAIDVGANIGVHTIAMAKACGSTGRVIAIEPDPANLSLLSRNLRANGCENVEIIAAAASAEAGSLFLFKSRNNMGDHRLYAPPEKRSKLCVPTVTIASIIAARNFRPRLLKIDIQGWETRALAGALAGLPQAGPFALVTEFWTEGLEMAGSSGGEYLSLLASLGGTVFEIDEARRRLKPVPPDLAPLRSRNLETNLLCVRGIAVDRWTSER